MSVIELSVKVVQDDGQSPFEAKLTMEADDRAETIAIAWVEMLRRAVALTKTMKEIP